MPLTVTSEITNNVARITLSGRLDASNANAFKVEIEKVAAHKVKSLALLLSGLEYMASAGLRVLVFAKQKMGADVKIYMVGTQAIVKETLELSGFHQAVTLLPTYDAALIEPS